MKLQTVFNYLRGGQLRLMLSAGRLTVPYYRLAWLAAALRHGLLERLSNDRLSLETLSEEMAPGAKGREALSAWLQLGVRLGELSKAADGYALRSPLARSLARPEHDGVAAMLEEIATLHHSLILETPARLRRGERWKLEDQDGVLIARSSRVIEPLVHEAIDHVLPASGAVRLLEVGAGSGTHIRHAARRNPQLTAVGLELQPAVAEMGMRNLSEWGLGDRARIEPGDIRERAGKREFDLVTLHNNIYYFEVDTRIELLRHVRGFLRPGGQLLLTTGCQGGSPALQTLDIWSAATEGCGRLPRVEELEQQMHEAGFRAVQARKLVPGESFFAFWGSEREACANS